MGCRVHPRSSRRRPKQKRENHAYHSSTTEYLPQAPVLSQYNRGGRTPTTHTPYTHHTRCHHTSFPSLSHCPQRHQLVTLSYALLQPRYCLRYDVTLPRNSHPHPRRWNRTRCGELLRHLRGLETRGINVHMHEIAASKVLQSILPTMVCR